MEFRNLTPFDTMLYAMLDVEKKPFHVVAMKVGYRLELDEQTGKCELVVLDRDKFIPLVLSDVPFDEFGPSAVKEESDLAPFKPRCDVIVNATAYAPKDAEYTHFPVSVQLLSANNEPLVDKRLMVFGERAITWHESTQVWQLSAPQPIKTLPLNYHYAYGGETIIHEAEQTELVKSVSSEFLLSETQRQQHPEQPYPPIAHTVVEYNPVGMGYQPKWYREAKGIQSIPAPQITADNVMITSELLHAWLEGDVRSEGTPALMPAGFGSIGRAWLPRRTLAGTYDEQWVEEQHPFLPADFDFGYWNSAPQDQQIAYPPLNAKFVLKNMTPNGILEAQLPGHRPFVLLRMQDGRFIPRVLSLDTLIIDTDKMQLSLTYRVKIPHHWPIRVLEARFEVDPEAPLVKLAKPRKEESEGGEDAR